MEHDPLNTPFQIVRAFAWTWAVLAPLVWFAAIGSVVIDGAIGHGWQLGSAVDAFALGVLLTIAIDLRENNGRQP